MKKPHPVLPEHMSPEQRLSEIAQKLAQELPGAL